MSATAGNGVSGKALDEFTATTAIVSDPDPTLTRSDYQLTVDWGDGAGASPASAALLPPGLGPICNTFQVKSSHVYNSPGTYTITTKISKLAGPGAPAAVTVTDTATIESYDDVACPFSLNPVPVAPSLQHKWFEIHTKNYSDASPVDARGKHRTWDTRAVHAER